jgi:hypothetical protein
VTNEIELNGLKVATPVEIRLTTEVLKAPAAEDVAFQPAQTDGAALEAAARDEVTCADVSLTVGSVAITVRDDVE